MGNVMKAVTNAVSLIKRKWFNNSEFKEILKDLEAKQGIHGTIVKLNMTQMLKRFMD